MRVLHSTHTPEITDHGVESVKVAKLYLYFHGEWHGLAPQPGRPEPEASLRRHGRLFKYKSLSLPLELLLPEPLVTS